MKRNVAARVDRKRFGSLDLARAGAVAVEGEGAVIDLECHGLIGRSALRARLDNSILGDDDVLLRLFDVDLTAGRHAINRQVVIASIRDHDVVAGLNLVDGLDVEVLQRNRARFGDEIARRGLYRSNARSVLDVPGSREVNRSRSNGLTRVEHD